MFNGFYNKLDYLDKLRVKLENKSAHKTYYETLCG